MSVLVVAQVPGDVEAFRQALTERSDEFRRIAERGRRAGALSHRFGVGQGFIQVIDEWDTVDHFQQFFGDPELQTFIKSVGGSGQPADVTTTEAVRSPDQF